MAALGHRDRLDQEMGSEIPPRWLQALTARHDHADAALGRLTDDMQQVKKSIGEAMALLRDLGGNLSGIRMDALIGLPTHGGADASLSLPDLAESEELSEYDGPGIASGWRACPDAASRYAPTAYGGCMVPLAEMHAAAEMCAVPTPAPVSHTPVTLQGESS